MITTDELKVLNHIIEDMEDHPECVQMAPEEMEKILEEYRSDRHPKPASDSRAPSTFMKR